MPEDIIMPRLSDSMEEGIIISWLIQSGDKIKEGQEIVEIETDKATMSYSSDYDGFIKIEAEVNTPISIGEKIASAYSTKEEALNSAAEKSLKAPNNKNPYNSSEASNQARSNINQDKIKASPIAKRIAIENSIDLNKIVGTGPGGRIVKNDVILFANRVTTTTEDCSRENPATFKPLSNLQKLVSEKMQDAKKIPHFYMSTDVDMGKIIKLITRFKAINENHPDHLIQFVPSINDFLIKITSETLKKHYLINSSYSEKGIAINSEVNIGIAVSRGEDLLVPVIKNADLKKLGQIAKESKHLINKVLDNTILPEDMDGGTFTISNLGMFNIKEFSAIINKPQAAILAVGAVEKRAVVAEDSIIPALTMTITLSSDHRIVYGAAAASFMKDLKHNLENPEIVLI